MSMVAQPVNLTKKRTLSMILEKDDQKLVSS